MEGQVSEKDWIVTKATIDSCDRTLWTSLTGGNDAYGEMATDTFVVDYSYLVGDRRFRGKYRAKTSQTVGHSFEISYDPLHPERNTGSGRFQNGWARAVIWAGAIVLVLAAVWLKGYLKLPPFWPQ